MLDLDLSRAMRTHTEVERLVAAVSSAGPHDEADWIEWKTYLDLGSHEGRGSLARHILGMANRDPDMARRIAGGCGYVLVGVEPGNCSGITPVDPADLEPQIQQFLGDDGPVWQPLWVRHQDGLYVLVVVVDPPSQGAPIYTLRKPFDKYDDGDVFVRRMGATHKANSNDIRGLTTRSRSVTEGGRLVVELLALDTAKVRPLDCSPNVLQRWLDDERNSLLRPVEELLAAEAEEHTDADGSDGLVHGTDPVRARARGSAMENIAMQMRAANKILGRVRKPEDRSPEDYRDQVQRYLDHAAEIAEHVAADRHIAQDACRLKLAIQNPTDFPFRDVEVKLYIPGDGVRAADSPSYEQLPTPPRSWGDRWVDPYSNLMSGVLGPLSSPDWITRGVLPGNFEPSLDIENHGSTTLTFPSVDLAPRAIRRLDEFDLIVPAQLAGQQLTAQWAARSTSVAGVVEGTLTITVAAEVVDAAELLAHDVEDDE